MDELIIRVTDAAGIGPDQASTAIAIILNFLRREAPDEVDALLARLPGADEVLRALPQPESAGGLLGGLMGMLGGGGLMELAGELSAAGLSMGEMQSVGHELFAAAREKVGDEAVGRIANAVPGLSQFI